MNDAKPTPGQTGFGHRVGSINFTMRRFHDAENEPLWRLRIARSYGEEPLIDMDALEVEMVLLREFCDQALKALRTDGGRRIDESEGPL